MKKRFALFSCLVLLCSFTAAAKADETIPDWEETSPAMASIVSFVEEVSDEASPEYVPASERIAVFDLDGTLFGERFPTYFDQCMMLHRILHDENYEEADPEDKAYCEALEAALLAPTAINQQRFSFKRNGSEVTAKAGTFVYTKMDLGIVKYHFELGAGAENFSWK